MDTGDVRYKFVHAKQILDIYRALCAGRTGPIESLCREFNQETNNGKNMEFYSKLLNKVIEETSGIYKKKSLSSLTINKKHKMDDTKHSIKNENNFELITWLRIKDKK